MFESVSVGLAGLTGGGSASQAGTGALDAGIGGTVIAIWTICVAFAVEDAQSTDAGEAGVIKSITCAAGRLTQRTSGSVDVVRNSAAKRARGINRVEIIGRRRAAGALNWSCKAGGALCLAGHASSVVVVEKRVDAEAIVEAV